MKRQAVAVSLAALIVISGCGTSTTHDLSCEGDDDALILTAQAVPGATMIPCITGYATGWTAGGFLAKTGSVRSWMDSDRAGTHAVEIELSEDCDTSAATEVDRGPDLSGVRRFEQSITTEPQLSGRRFFTFAGGCVTLRYDFAEGASSDLLLEAEASVMLVPRDRLVTALAENRDLILCGAGAPPCE